MKTSALQITVPLDKARLEAWVLKSPTPTKKLAVLLPGFLDSKDYPHLIHLGEELAKHGYSVISFNPSGTWSSDKTTGDYSISQYIAEVEVAMKFMEQSEKYEKIIVCGHSLGGMVAMLYAAQTKRSTISAVIAIMSPYAFVRMENYHKRVIEWGEVQLKKSERDDPFIPGQKVTFHVPFSFVEDSMQYNILDEVKNLDLPLLLIAGAQDTLIPPEQVKEVFEHANQPKELMIVEGADHNYRNNLKQVTEVNRSILRFLAKAGV